MQSDWGLRTAIVPLRYRGSGDGMDFESRSLERGLILFDSDRGIGNRGEQLWNFAS